MYQTISGENQSADGHLYDVIIIGGSYAGLSAAMSLGRARRSVLIIDNGQPCNKNVAHAHNLLAHDGTPPAVIAAKARKEVTAYPTVTLLTEEASALEGQNNDFIIHTKAGDAFRAKKILFATGVRDLPMLIEGFSECWGISVLHCPYCHGYEVRDLTMGVIGNGDMGFEYARLISNWTSKLTLFTNGASTMSAAQHAKLASHKIRIAEQPVTALQHHDGFVQAVRLNDGSIHEVAAVFARGGTEQHCPILQHAGCVLHQEGMYAGLIQTDDFGKTTVPGIFAAGDNCSPMRSLANAIAAGNKAGGVINHELIAGEF